MKISKRDYLLRLLFWAGTRIKTTATFFHPPFIVGCCAVIVSLPSFSPDDVWTDLLATKVIPRNGVWLNKNNFGRHDFTVLSKILLLAYCPDE